MASAQLPADAQRPAPDQERYEEAWSTATAGNHDELDDVLLRELAAQDR
jgi:hypothetical protein